jgi:predicted peptidase
MKVERRIAPLHKNGRMRLALAVIAFAVMSCGTLRTYQTGFLDRTVVVHGHTYPYVVYVPREWTPERQWPVVLFLHGAGERGSDGHKQTQIGVGAAIRGNAARVPAIVVFPQAPEETRWIGEPAEAALLALDAATREFRGDPARTYLTGLSLGGFGTWHLALANPHRFAALVVVCGGIVPNGSAPSVRQSPLTAGAPDPYRFTAERLRDIPIRIYHGADDTVIRPDESRRMYAALMAEQAKDVAYVEYPGVGHNAWEKAYADDAMWKWLFAQHR